MYVYVPHKHFGDLVSCDKLMAAFLSGDWAWRSYCQWQEKSFANNIDMNIRNSELWNCLKPSTKGDTFVQCSPYKCAPGGRFKCKPLNATLRLKIIKILTNPWWNSVAILLKLVTVLKLDRGTRRIHAWHHYCTNESLHLDITHRYKQAIIFNKKLYHIYMYCRKRNLFFKIFLEKGALKNYSQSMKKATTRCPKEVWNLNK